MKYDETELSGIKCITALLDGETYADDHLIPLAWQTENAAGRFETVDHFVFGYDLRKAFERFESIDDKLPAYRIQSSLDHPGYGVRFRNKFAMTNLRCPLRAPKARPLLLPTLCHGVAELDNVSEIMIGGGPNGICSKCKQRSHSFYIANGFDDFTDY